MNRHDHPAVHGGEPSRDDFATIQQIGSGAPTQRGRARIGSFHENVCESTRRERSAGRVADGNVQRKILSPGLRRQERRFEFCPGEQSSTRASLATPRRSGFGEEDAQRPTEPAGGATPGDRVPCRRFTVALASIPHHDEGERHAHTYRPHRLGRRIHGRIRSGRAHELGAGHVRRVVAQAGRRRQQRHDDARRARRRSALRLLLDGPDEGARGPWCHAGIARRHRGRQLRQGSRTAA